MTDKKDKIELGATFFPTKDQKGASIPWESLFIPYIYKEIWMEGVYVDILSERKDLVIVDIGANIGITVDHFRKYAKKVYAVEPSPEHFAALAKNKEFNKWDNVELFNYALADKDGEMEFHQSVGNRTMNSLTTSALPGRFNEDIKVKTKSIDHFFEEAGIDQVDFMKFDPEGAEDMILRSEGFRKIAPKVKAIEVEFHFPTWQNLVQYMIDLGYQAKRYEASAIIVLFTRP